MTTDTDDTSNIRIYGNVVVFRLEACRGFDIRAIACMLEYETATMKHKYSRLGGTIVYGAMSVWRPGPRPREQPGTILAGATVPLNRLRT